MPGNVNSSRTGSILVSTLVATIEKRSLIRDRGGFSEALHAHLMLATGFLIRDRVVTEGETSNQACNA